MKLKVLRKNEGCTEYSIRIRTESMTINRPNMNSLLRVLLRQAFSADK